MSDWLDSLSKVTSGITPTRLMIMLKTVTLWVHCTNRLAMKGMKLHHCVLLLWMIFLMNFPILGLAYWDVQRQFPDWNTLYIGTVCKWTTYMLFDSSLQRCSLSLDLFFEVSGIVWASQGLVLVLDLIKVSFTSRAVCHTAWYSVR